MSRTHRLQLGGLCFQLDGGGDAFAEVLSGWFSPYLVSSAERSPNIQLQLDTTSIPNTKLEGAQIESLGERCFVMKRWGVEGRFDEENGQGEFQLEPTRYSLDAILRMVLTVYLPRRQGSLVHAASTVRRGQGYLFPGRSGAGKSTLARAAGGNPLLTDEMSLVRKVDGQWRVYGTPFHGELQLPPKAADAPLVGIGFPDRSRSLGRHPLRHAEALARLTGCLLCYAREHALDEQLLSVATSMATDLPAFALSFDPERPVWPLIEEALAA